MTVTRFGLLSALVACPHTRRTGRSSSGRSANTAHGDGKPDLTGVYQASTRRGPWDFEAPGGEPGQPAGRSTPVNAGTRDAIHSRTGLGSKRRRI